MRFISLLSIILGLSSLSNASGRVVTWGQDLDLQPSEASELSSGVTSIFSTVYAFAALKEDGSVVTWGDSSYGGDSSSVS